MSIRWVDATSGGDYELDEDWWVLRCHPDFVVGVGAEIEPRVCHPVRMRLWSSMRLCSSIWCPVSPER
eukprot:2219758-Rhodomonas_salina.1